MEELFEKVFSSDCNISNNNISIRCGSKGCAEKVDEGQKLYIQLEFPYMYKCFRCEVSGSFLYNKNDDPDIFYKYYESGKVANLQKYLLGKSPNNDIDNLNLQYNKSRSHKIKLSYKNKYHNYKDYPSFKYLSDRIGRDLSMSEIIKYRIILDCPEFVSINNIDTRVNLKHYIGFLSFDGSSVVMRNFGPNNENFRYFKKTLFKGLTSNVIFVRDTNKILNREKLNILICEGQFDALVGITKDESYDIAVSSGSLAHNISIESLIRCFGLSISQMDNIDILLDNDSTIGTIVKDRKISKLKEFLKMNFIINTQSKDIGNINDKIMIRNLYT